MYPITFENLYFEKIWGGRDLERFRKNLPLGNIGESWDVSCHHNGMSIVKNGEYKGKTLQELIEMLGNSLVGRKVDCNNFPLLIKLINSKEKLSVQVHPGDEYAKKNEGENGKAELWYVIAAEEDAHIVVGTKDCSREDFIQAIKEGTVENYLNSIVVREGDCFFINSGLVHAIGKGLIIAEIQQSSDTTYRVYDYGRPRELHIEKALEVIDFDLKSANLREAKTEVYEGYRKTCLCSNEHFTIEKIDINDSYRGISDPDRFELITCVSGKGVIKGTSEFTISLGDSYMIPAELGEYFIEGNAILLRSFPKVHK